MVLKNVEQIVHQFNQEDDPDPESLGYPSGFCKACVDGFRYAMKLRDSSIVEFAAATPINSEWVMLGVDEDWGPTGFPFPCKHRIEVRVRDIVWVVDGPKA